MLPVNLQKMLKKSMYVHKYNTRSCTKGNFEVELKKVIKKMYVNGYNK